MSAGVKSTQPELLPFREMQQVEALTPTAAMLTSMHKLQRTQLLLPQDI